jgi:excisionase family DNA binding protein
MSDKKYYSREEASAYLGLGTSTLAAWASNGRQDLPYTKMGRMVRYRKEDLDAFMEKGIQKKEVEIIDPKPTDISTPQETSQEAKNLAILSEALLKIHGMIGDYAKLEACGSLLTPHNVEKVAQTMRACMMHLYAVTRSDQRTAEVWAHKIKLLTIGR